MPDPAPSNMNPVHTYPLTSIIILPFTPKFPSGFQTGTLYSVPSLTLCIHFITAGSYVDVMSAHAGG
jgi:hypothetical protein